MRSFGSPRAIFINKHTRCAHKSCCYCFVVGAAEEAQNGRKQVKKLPPSASNATGPRLMRAAAKKIVVLRLSNGR